MATFFTGDASNYTPATSNSARALTVSTQPVLYQVLAFDAATDQTAYWRFLAPQGLTGTITLRIYYRMASATANAVVFQAQLQAVTPADALDLDVSSSFDTANSSGAVTVPGTAGYLGVITITMTNADSIAAGDYCILSINRDADNASDTATGDAYIELVELRDSA